MEPWLHHIPRSLTVEFIGSPIKIRCSPDDPLDHAVDRLREQLDSERSSPERPAVRRGTALLEEHAGGCSVAVLDEFLIDPAWHEEFREDPVPISSIAVECALSNAIDASTNFVAALEQFASHNPVDGEWRPVGLDQPLLILQRGERIAVMRDQHFRNTPVRLAVFSFLLELEEEILNRASRDPHEAFQALSPGRQQKVRTLEESYFIDKLEIARSLGWCWTGVSRSKTESIMARLEKARNWCAHPKEDSFTPQWLLNVIGDAREAMLSVQST